jgi:hypothetical protein
LNSSFLLPNIQESISNDFIQVNSNLIIEFYEKSLKEKPNLYSLITGELQNLVTYLINQKINFIHPSTKRFLIFFVLHPNSKSNADMNYWKDLFSFIKKDNQMKIWLLHLEAKPLIQIYTSIMPLLNALLSTNVDIYHNSITEIVDFLFLIWNSALKLSNVDFKQFCNHDIDSKINLVSELEKYKSNTSPWCYVKNGSFLLSTNQKIEFVRKYFMSVVSSHHNPTFYLEVRRDNILIDSFLQISQVNNPEITLKAEINVTFKGELGVDAGGVRKDFFQVLIEKFTKQPDESDLYPFEPFFNIKGGFYWFNPKANDESSIQAFYLSGVIFGMALLNGILLNLKFPIALYRKLRHLPIGFDELKEFDETVSNSMTELLNYDGNVEEELGTMFEYCGVPLKTNGNNIPVTNENRKEYVDLVIDHIFNKSVDYQYHSFIQGILISAGSFALEMFHPKELDLLLTGSDEIDFHELESITQYNYPFTKDSVPVQNFWKIVHTALNDQEKKDLLYFTTASYRAPAEGIKTMRFEIHCDNNSEHLPQSHTCFNQLVLPNDSNYDNLLAKIRTAITVKEMGTK